MAKRRATRARSLDQIRQKCTSYEDRLNGALASFDQLFQQMVRKQALINRYGKQLAYYRKRLIEQSIPIQPLPARQLRRISIPPVN